MQSNMYEKGVGRMARTSFKLKRTSTTTSSKGSGYATKGDVQKLVEKKAYELWEKRGRKDGFAVNDWLEAERIVKAKLAG